MVDHNDDKMWSEHSFHLLARIVQIAIFFFKARGFSTCLPLSGTCLHKLALSKVAGTASHRICNSDSSPNWNYQYIQRAEDYGSLVSIILGKNKSSRICRN